MTAARSPSHLVSTGSGGSRCRSWPVVDLGGWTSPDGLGAVRDWEIRYISDLANSLRGLLFSLSLFTIVAFMLAPVISWVLWRTRFGLRVRICGEHPQAGESQGIDIYRYKFVAVLLSGALAAFGGAFIASPELNGIYLEGSTLNRGFIGLAALLHRQLPTSRHHGRVAPVCLPTRPRQTRPRRCSDTQPAARDGDRTRTRGAVRLDARSASRRPAWPRPSQYFACSGISPPTRCLHGGSISSRS